MRTLPGSAFLCLLLFLLPGLSGCIESSTVSGYGQTLPMQIIHTLNNCQVYEADVTGDGVRDAAIVLPDGSIRLFVKKDKSYCEPGENAERLSRELIQTAVRVKKAEIAAGLCFTAHSLESELLSMKCSTSEEKNLRNELLKEIEDFLPACLDSEEPSLEFERRCARSIDSAFLRLENAGIPTAKYEGFLKNLKEISGGVSRCVEPLSFPPPLDKYVGSGEKIVLARKPSREGKVDGWVILLAGGEVKMAFPATYGIDNNDKIRQGDKRTPEGEFLFCGKNAKSEYHRFIEIGYPNCEDGSRGLRDKLISEEEHNEIISAIASGSAPPYDTALGGEVGLHGLPISCSDATLFQDVTSAGNWSFGCIVVLNRDIDALWDEIRVGDKIFIFRWESNHTDIRNNRHDI